MRALAALAPALASAALAFVAGGDTQHTARAAAAARHAPATARRAGSAAPQTPPATSPPATPPQPTPTAPTTTNTQPATPPQPPPPKPAAPKVLYRIVGCVSHGAGAYRQGPARREVAIGFDDGPWNDTAAFVRMLERSGARATFFMIGEQVIGSYRSLLLRELRDGDVLGDHSFTHPVLTQGGDVSGQLRQTIGAIRSLTGYTPCVFRPPYGAFDTRVVAAARSLGMATVLWNVDPTDWALPGTGAIVARVLEQVRPGSIIISHDGGGPRAETLAAYPAIIATLRRRGYRIVTIPELLGFKPVYVPCIKLCDGIGVPRRLVPRGAVIRRAP